MDAPLPSLDLSTFSLQRGEGRTLLRPKDFAVLQHLMARPGRLVSKDALLEAGWPGVFVTDAVLKASISRLRAALGDDAAAPRFIETIPRRGYRLVSPIAVTESGPPEQQPPAGGPSLDTLRCVVGRGEHLARLDAVLGTAASGTRQVVFVTGEAGVGKTALVDHFLQVRAARRVLTGRGQCIERYGTGEAYMPILDALASVCSGPHGEMAIAALARHAPGWLAQMPGVLAAVESSDVLERAAGVTRARMLRDLVDALDAIAAKMPVALVLEDLHWSDASTLDAIAAIARRRAPARLALLCTYRPEDLSPGEHPLLTVARELRLQRLALDVHLTSLDEVAVTAYLAARFPGAVIPPRVTRGIHQRTDGHPLFLSALADDWVAIGWLVWSDGRWKSTVPVENLERHVPDGMRQIVDARLDRLHVDDRRLVEAASVAGTTFSAASVAAALDRDVAPVDDACTALARRGFLLQADGSETWPDGTTAGRYRFTHALYQEMTYGQMSAARRRYLHQRIAARERDGYGADASRIAARLAMHFDRGGDLESAVGLHTAAAKNALTVGGYQEAAAHAAAGLSALARVPAAPHATARELTLRLLRGAAVSASRGFAAEEAERAYARAHELSRSLADGADALPALAGLFAFHLMRGSTSTTRALGEEMLIQSRRAGHGPGEVWACMAVGVARLQIGDLAGARALFDEVLARYPSHAPGDYARVHTVDPLLAALGYASWTLWLMGHADRALERGQEALALAEARRQPVDRAHALVLQTHLHQMRREPARVAACAAEALRVSSEFGIEQYLWPATIIHGWAQAVSADPTGGLAELERGMAAWDRVGAQYAQPRHYALLVEARASAGDLAGARDALHTAVEIARATGERFWMPELHRMEGDLHLRLADGRLSSRPRNVNCARGCFEAAIQQAEEQGSAMLQLRALTSLCRLERLLGRPRAAAARAAEQRLRRVCASLTEGRDTPDVMDAKSLLRSA